ncbi:MAG: ribonuclease H-like domain-containing protein [Caldilineaceae bacterium]|nr:ribonuclease H-like domain-containing protein [Caldilineaceae bacterium]
MSTLDRLRRLHSVRPQHTPAESPLPPVLPVPLQESLRAPSLPKGTLEALVPGEVIENSNGTCYVVTERYPLQASRGAYPLAQILDHQPTTFATFHPAFGLQQATDFRQAVFLDTETTGLGGGAGVYCFMVGVGTFEIGNNPLSIANGSGGESQAPVSNHQPPLSTLQSPIHFVVRQFFMRNPGEEGALLLALVALLERYDMSVTFNGRTFDLPLLRTRLRQNQQIYPELRGSGRLLQSDRPHLDLLHPARRLWKRRLQSCRLINLEAEILGLRRSEEDVPGALIPQLYTDYLHNGQAGELSRVFYHNREDIVSMVALTTALSGLYAGKATPGDTPRHGLDWFSLGRCYEEGGEWEAAERAYRAAAEGLAGQAAQGEVFRHLGQLFKRQARWAEATAIWQTWITTVAAVDTTPYEELAKYCEWQCKDWEQAAMWTGWALHTLRRAPAWQQATTQITDLEHRLARLQRKQQGHST